MARIVHPTPFLVVSSRKKTFFVRPIFFSLSPHLSSGHVLCSSCCNTIVEKTSPRLSPVCPFCREPFTSDSVRLIRIDFTASRWETPRFKTTSLELSEAHNDSWKQEDRILLEPNASRSREEARRLEDRVAKVAVKKCSVEEVSTLHRELQQWLKSDVKSDDQVRPFATHSTVSALTSATRLYLCPSVLRCCGPFLRTISPTRKPSEWLKMSNLISRHSWMMQKSQMESLSQKYASKESFPLTHTCNMTDTCLSVSRQVSFRSYA